MTFIPDGGNINNQPQLQQRGFISDGGNIRKTPLVTGKEPKMIFDQLLGLVPGAKYLWDTREKNISPVDMYKEAGKDVGRMITGAPKFMGSSVATPALSLYEATPQGQALRGKGYDYGKISPLLSGQQSYQTQRQQLQDAGAGEAYSDAMPLIQWMMSVGLIKKSAPKIQKLGERVIKEYKKIPNPEAGIFAGETAVGFPQAKNKFTTLADKKTRFEIDDSKAKLKIKKLEDIGDMSPNYKKFSEKGITLDDVLDHPNLYKNYPEFKNIKVKFAVYTNSNKTAAQFIPKTNTINLNIANLASKKMRSTLLHEVQHVIQEKEGFAKGGEPKMFKTINLGVDTASAKKINEVIRQAPADLQAKLFEQYRKKNPDRQIVREIEDQLGVTALRLNARAVKITPTEQYHKLAGEIESRDVANRMNLTSEQRLHTPPYASQNIPLKNQIVKPSTQKAGLINADSKTSTTEQLFTPYKDVLGGIRNRFKTIENFKDFTLELGRKLNTKEKLDPFEKRFYEMANDKALIEGLNSNKISGNFALEKIYQSAKKIDVNAKVGRPQHQMDIEKEWGEGIKNKDLSKVQDIVNKIPETDPYKVGIQRLIDRKLKEWNLEPFKMDTPVKVVANYAGKKVGVVKNPSPEYFKEAFSENLPQRAFLMPNGELISWKPEGLIHGEVRTAFKIKNAAPIEVQPGMVIITDNIDVNPFKTHDLAFKDAVNIINKHRAKLEPIVGKDFTITDYVNSIPGKKLDSYYDLKSPTLRYTPLIKTNKISYEQVRKAQIEFSSIPNQKLKYNTAEQINDFKKNILTTQNETKNLQGLIKQGIDIKDGKSVTLYRGSSDKLGDNIRPQSFFTTNKAVAKRFGKVNEVRVDIASLINRGEEMAGGGLTFQNPTELTKGKDGIYRIPEVSNLKNKK